MKIPKKELKDFLDRKSAQYNSPNFIGSDPVSIPHQFSNNEDIEISAFFSATIAWGQRPTIIKNANRLMQLMDDEPYNFIINHSKGDLKAFEHFKHRTFKPEDVTYFIGALKNIYVHHGRLERSFSAGSRDMKENLIKFHKLFFDWNPPGRTYKHIANVEKNSSAKRLNMFLRWMARKDNNGVDFGIWKSISPAQLYCPLDLHSARVARKLGLLKRSQNDWRAVEELTNSLRKFDPTDPVKYDFALFGLGVFEKF